MKSLKNLFEKIENQKSFSNFNSVLDVNSMFKIKGGEGIPVDDDLWPPTKTGNI